MQSPTSQFDVTMLYLETLKCFHSDTYSPIIIRDLYAEFIMEFCWEYFTHFLHSIKFRVNSFHYIFVEKALLSLEYILGQCTLFDIMKLPWERSSVTNNDTQILYGIHPAMEFHQEYIGRIIEMQINARRNAAYRICRIQYLSWSDLFRSRTPRHHRDRRRDRPRRRQSRR